MKRIAFLIAIIMAAIVFLNFSVSTEKANIISQLSGKVYYLKRDGQTLNLYSSNADLTQKKLIYAHRGEENNNIIDFYFDKESELIYFVAMRNKEWSLFSIDEDTGKPNYIESLDWEKSKDFQTYYIQSEQNNMKLLNKKGSLYLVKNGEEQMLQRFIGIYDSKFNSGYVPMGFSPDNKYVIYHSSEHLTPVGTLIEGLFDRDYNLGQDYIMELETKKIEKYPPFYALQWVKE